MDNKSRIEEYYVFSKFFLSGSGTWPFQHKIILKISRYFWATQQTIILVAKVHQ